MEPDIGFIDEPNAAFLSHMHASASLGDGLGHDLSRRPMRLCVYDIGAGTCDVSILEVSLLDGRPLSRNLAISRFTALGGDDFDRAIARQILVPQLLEQNPAFDPSETDVTERIVPRLMPVAEALKIAVTNRLRDQGIERLSDCTDTAPILVNDVTPFRASGPGRLG